MRQQIVTLMKQERIPFKVDDKKSYHFRRDKKFHFLQRICLKILEEIGAHRTIMDETISYVQINPNDTLEAIFRQKIEMCRQDMPERAQIFIGADDWNELFSHAQVHHHITMNVKSQGPQIHGMNVTIVPWMKGVLVAPL